ncbi:MAG: response regulator [Pseudomonadales bacterium]|nr:response regulator [Pseudomonadales bacterium]MCP5185850.1 response regulator [Pseudomonadales bacterium]
MSLRLVLADDEAPTARVMSLALAKQGFDVEVCYNGEEALNSILQSPPDVLVTDIEMPVMTGQELCEELQKRLPERTFPIYVITGVTDLVHRKWTREIQDLFFLEKPVSIRRLTQELEQRLRS